MSITLSNVQWILVFFLLLDLQMNVTYDNMNFIHLTRLLLLHYRASQMSQLLTPGIQHRHTLYNQIKVMPVKQLNNSSLNSNMLQQTTAHM